MNQGREKSSSSSSLEAIIFRFDYGITLAGCVLEPRSIQDYYFAAPVVDYALLAERICGHADTGPSHTEHPREKILRKREFILLNAIVGEQQPAGEPLFEGVGSIAAGRLSNLSKQGIGEVQKKIEQ